MPLAELDILDFVAMTATVQEFHYPELPIYDFLFPTSEETDGGRYFAYDLLKASRDIAQPTSPGAPSKNVALQAVGQKSGQMIRLAESKTLGGEMLANLRAMGRRSRERAAIKVAQEQRDLHRRNRRFKEYAAAKMLTGTLTISADDVKATLNYGIATAHKPTASASWATAGTDIPGDIRTWKRLIRQNSGYEPTHAICNEGVMKNLMANTAVKEYLGEGAYKAQVGRNGAITEFMGLTIHVWDHGYVPSGGSFTRFIADDKFIITPEPDGSWCKELVGSEYVAQPGSDELTEAFGEYSTAEIMRDPAGVKTIVGDNFIPAMPVPDAVVYADVTP